MSIVYKCSNGYAHLITSDGPEGRRFRVTVLNDPELNETDDWLLAPCQCFGHAIENVDLRYA